MRWWRRCWAWQAAFVDDILSLVALTMLLQIGIAESTGAELSLWRVAKPLVFSVLFCVGESGVPL